VSSYSYSESPSPRRATRSRSYSSYEYSDEDGGKRAPKAKAKAAGKAKAKAAPGVVTRSGTVGASSYEMEVRIGSAKGLRNADAGGKDLSDPYCICEASGPEPQYDLSEYKKRLEIIYKERDPVKVAKIPTVLQKYAGQEHFLYEMICYKWGVPYTWDGRSALPPRPRDDPPDPQNSFRTPAKKNRLDPVWNHTGNLIIAEGESLVFRIRDEDEAIDDELGKGILTFDQMSKGFDGEVKLVDLLQSGPAPTLKVSVKVLKKQEPHERGAIAKAGGISFKLPKQAYAPANRDLKLSREERESAAIGRIQAKFRGVLERVMLKERREIREARKREEQYQELLKEIAETCPGGSCAPGYGFEQHLSQLEVDHRFFLERKEKLRINTGAGPTRGLSSLPVPEGQPGPRQTGGVPPAVIKAAKPETPFGTGLSIVPPSVARTAAGRLPPSGAAGPQSLAPAAGTSTLSQGRTRKVGAAGPALLGSDAGARTNGSLQALSAGARGRGYAGTDGRSGTGEMPPGLSEEEAMKWQMQNLGAQLRSEAVERAKEQSRQPSRQQSRAASPTGRAQPSPQGQGRGAGAPQPRPAGMVGTGGF